MRAAAIDRFGGPEVITLHTLPVPEIGERGVLIAVHTSGVAGWDADMRQGWSPRGRTKLPFIPGTDGSGTVVQVGTRVRRFQVGDQVYAASFEKAGWYAEYVAVEADQAAHLPEGLDLTKAGAIPITGTTALQGIENVLHVKRRENVVVHGGSGGVGILALQFAKHRGARVLATASGADGVALVRRLGADDGVDARHGDLTVSARQFAPDGVDAVLALVGGESLEQLLRAVRTGGRVAYPGGVEPAPKKRRGVEVLSYDGNFEAPALDRLGRTARAARLNVPIAARFPLEQASEAHVRLAEGHVLGKIVLRIG
jgi:NADPH:quinone reductase-like Zn-dependent oxidoreductase